MAFLSDELLDRIHDRAAQYDRDNSFPEQDLLELRDIGYLGAFVPEEYGGSGLSLLEIAQCQRELAKAAPATALAINMHQIIVGVGKYLVRNGNPKGEAILRDAAAGELFAFGISEPGNDLVLFGSITDAVPSGDGGFEFTGRKIFVSMAPAWTRLFTFGRDDTGGIDGNEGPRSVFAVLRREDGGFQMKDDWNTLGMRATQSNTILLEGARADSEWVLTRTIPGPSADPLVFGVFSHFEILLAATYTGIGERAVEVAVEHVKTRQSVKNQTTYDQDPDIRWRIAEAALIMNAVWPQIEVLARDVDEEVDRGPLWMPQLSAVKNSAAEATLRAVEQSIRACGGSSYYQGHELSRLYRDALAGLFQPTDQESLHGAWANMLLGPVK